MQESYMLRIGRHIQSLRIERGLTEKQLAEGICSVTLIRDMETGRTFATLNLFQRIAERLAISLQDLLSVDHLPPSFHANHPAQGSSLAAYRQILSMIEKIEATDEIREPQWTSVMLNKADALAHTGATEQAIELLGQIQARVQQDPDAELSLHAVIYQKLGHAYYHAPNMLESYTHYMQAYLISARVNEYSPLTSRITMDLARVGEQLGGTKELADQLFQLGIAAQKDKDLSRSCTYLEQAHALYKAHNMVAMGKEMKLAYESLIRTQRNPEHAIQELMFTAKRLEKAGDTAQLANTLAQKADLHLNLGQLELAQTELTAARTLFDEEMAAQDPRLTLVYHVQARHDLLAEEYGSAVSTGEQSARCYAEMQFYQQAAESLQLVVQAYRAQGLEEQATAADAESERLKHMKFTPF